MKSSVRLCFNFSELLWMKVLPLFLLALFSSLRQLQKQICLHKKESSGASLQLGWTLENWQPNLQIGELFRDQEGKITRPWTNSGFLFVPWPKRKRKRKRKNNPHTNELKARSHIKESFPRATEMLSEVAGLSVLWISGVSLDIFLLAETEHPWGKDTDLSFVYSIGGDVLPCFDKCVYKVKGICLLCCFCLL